MGSFHCGHTKKDEDQRLADAAPHFQEVLYGGVGLVRNISLYVGSHHRSTRYEPEKERNKKEASR